jgi:hypothetical protein
MENPAPAGFFSRHARIARIWCGAAKKPVDNRRFQSWNPRRMWFSSADSIECPLSL